LDAAEWLMKSYRGAVETRYKTKVWGLQRRKDLEKSKHLPGLVEAVNALREADIAPASWAAFSVDVWRDCGEVKRDNKGKLMPPPIKWMWSAKRIRERQDWFADEASTYETIRVTYGDKAKALMAKWGQYQAAIFRAAVRGHPLEKVTTQFWPNNSYEVLLAEANAEAARLGDMMQARAAQGAWLGW
jgi:hypothetical protein